MDQKIYITKCGFVWLIVTSKAIEIFKSGLFSLFVIYEDESETLIENLEHLNQVLKSALKIGIEVGSIKFE